LTQPRWEHPAPRPFWPSLDRVERDAITARAKEENYWDGAILCHQDDTTSDLFIIKSGWVKVMIEVDGRQKIIALRGPGDVIGERAAFEEASRSATVVAMGNVRALVVSTVESRALVLEHPHVLEVMRRQEYDRLTTEGSTVFANEHAGVERRLASLLSELALLRGGLDEDGSMTITLPVSTQDLADCIDDRPEAISWFLSTWRQRGIVQTADHQVTVVDAAALEKICGVEAIRPQPGLSATSLHVAPWAPLNWSIFYTDIASFGSHDRNDDDRRIVRDALYQILQEVFESSNVPWHACTHEDRGDGILTVVPPTLSTVLLVDPLVPFLAAKLREYNRRAGAPVRMQLRAALHVGPVLLDQRGLGGEALIHTARILEAPILKGTLASTGADLGFIASGHVYDNVIRQFSRLVDPSAYQRIKVQVKEADVTSWMYLAGGNNSAAHPGVESEPDNR
jgi:CRP-like cAMP-binding protein